MAEGQDENMAEELGGALAGEMDVDDRTLVLPAVTVSTTPRQVLRGWKVCTRSTFRA